MLGGMLVVRSIPELHPCPADSHWLGAFQSYTLALQTAILLKYYDDSSSDSTVCSSGLSVYEYTSQTAGQHIHNGGLQ